MANPSGPRALFPGLIFASEKEPKLAFSKASDCGEFPLLLHSAGEKRPDKCNDDNFWDSEWRSLSGVAIEYSLLFFLRLECITLHETLE
jgi:hypothetical protein